MLSTRLIVECPKARVNINPEFEGLFTYFLLVLIFTRKPRGFCNRPQQSPFSTSQVKPLIIKSLVGLKPLPKIREVFATLR